MREGKSASKTVKGKLMEKRPLGRPKGIFLDNIGIYLK